MGRMTKKFGEEKISKLLLTFAFPIMISFLVSEIYGMVDTIFVGKFVSDSAIGSLVMVFPLGRIAFALGIMISVGATTALSRSNGRNDIERMKKFITTGFSLTVCIMLLLSVGGFLMARPILRFLGARGDILEGAVIYLRTASFGLLFLNLTVFFSNVMLNLGDNKLAITTNVIGAACNVVFDYLLVIVFDMGIAGAGIATSISEVIAFGYAYHVFSRAKKEYGISLRLQLKREYMLPVLLVGISAFIVEAEDGFVIGIFNRLLSSHGGDSGVIVLGVITKIYMFLFIAMFALTSAMQPIAAYNLGSGNYRRMETVAKDTILFSLAVSFVSWGLAMIFAPQLIRGFVENPALVEESVRAFRLMILAFPALSVYYASIFFFQATKKVRTSIFLSLFRQIFIMIPIAFVLVKIVGLGATGIWLSYPVADLVSCVVAGIFMRQEHQELEHHVEIQAAHAKAV